MSKGFYQYIADERLKLLYSIVYSYWYFYDKSFLPQAIHVYTYKLIQERAIKDLWGDWFWTGMGPHSYKLGYELVLLSSQGLLEKVCIGNGVLCGLLTLPNYAPKPEKLYLAML
ncbi:MAG: hypothetical protein DRO13_01875 [Thermoprotei archaeon]|nr:MAG: hypothetical protein DRO13_01875 [Thermoprotei archaeon]